jgi:hypothetical protein
VHAAQHCPAVGIHINCYFSPRFLLGLSSSKPFLRNSHVIERIKMHQEEVVTPHMHALCTAEAFTWLLHAPCRTYTSNRLNIAAPGLLANDKWDCPDGTLTLTGPSKTANGLLAIDPKDGSFSYISSTTPSEQQLQQPLQYLLLCSAMASLQLLVLPKQHVMSRLAARPA